MNINFIQIIKGDKLQMIFFLLSIIVCLSNIDAGKGEKMLYKDASKSIDSRVEDLLSRMTIEEKVAQMLCLWFDKNKILNENGKFDAEKARKVIIPYGIGHIARPSDNIGRETEIRTRTIEETVELVNSIQKFIIENTRLGIPVLFHEEGLHGLMAKDATSFPQAIALASSWEPKIVEEVFSVIASEMRARGVHLALSPVVDVCRDPRWGRVEETYGEDPYLVSEIGMAAVRGLQGRSLPLASGKVFATLKHLTGHGQPESGINTAPSAIPERMLREIFLFPFERCIKEANAMSVMASYNEIDGIPSHANHFLLTDILRKEWGFEGIVLSDYFAISELISRHHIAESADSAAVVSFSAGVDVELPDPNVYPKLVELVRVGKIKEEEIDKKVRRILMIKFLAGLFENPYVNVDEAVRITGSKESRQCALKAAQKCIVLLKNEKNLLPLDRNKVKRIAVIGPNASETILGGYSEEPIQTVSILDGIRQKCGNLVKVDFAQGVKITKSRGWWVDKVELANKEENQKMIFEAVDVVKGADCAILAIGENEQVCREGWSENHLGDRSSLDILGEQSELVNAIIETGVPVIIILINGRPLSINYIAEKANAILECWYLGQETGRAVADVLFGDVNPGGKLPITIPRSVGQLPAFYNYKPTARRGYLFDTVEPLFPFGFGLSYTTFKFENLRLKKREIKVTESTTVEVDVINTGKRKGDEVVQLYIRDMVSSVTRPVKELKGFKRVTLQEGEHQTVSFPITPINLCFYNKEMKRVVEPGEFEIMVGPDSKNLIKTILRVTH